MVKKLKTATKRTKANFIANMPEYKFSLFFVS